MRDPIAYYNDSDPHAAAWLDGLITASLITPGRVDGRSIADVGAADFVGFRRAHFFAGIAGWDHALGLAGWPADRPVWTGSCPCPPFSSAGKKQRCPACGGRSVPCPRRTGHFICLGCEHAWHADGRHLWPEFFRLIRECRPPVVFGEQVASPDGRVWLAGVRACLERIGYAVGAADLCSAGAGEEGEGWILRGGRVDRERIVLGGPHIRQRIYWVASRRWGDRGLADAEGRDERRTRERESGDGRTKLQIGRHRPTGRLADTPASGWRRPGSGCRTGGRPADESGRLRPISGLGDPIGDDLGRYGRCPSRSKAEGDRERQQDGARGVQPRCSGSDGDFDFIPCTDGKTRRSQPGLFPLVDGVPFRLADGRTREDASRPSLLKGIGNAIVPQVAAEFVKSFLEAIDDPTLFDMGAAS